MPELPQYQFLAVKSFAVGPIVALYEEVGWWDDSPKHREAIPRVISGSCCFMVVLDAKQQLVGMGRLISDGVSVGYIHDVVVTESCRGQGIGQELIKRLAKQGLKLGLDWVGLWAEPGTQGLYEKLGFDHLKGYEAMLLNGKRFEAL